MTADLILPTPVYCKFLREKKKMCFLFTCNALCIGSDTFMYAE